jgi:hypothetical protein
LFRDGSPDAEQGAAQFGEPSHEASDDCGPRRRLVLLPTLALAETKSLDVAASFHAVDVSSGIRATVSGGHPASLVVDADARDIADLRHEVRDGVLYLWYDWNVGNLFDWSNREVSVTIGTELLDSVAASAGANVVASVLMGEDIGLEATSGAFLKAEAIEGMFYDLEATSGARIETSGFCTSADVEATTGASIGAKGLDCAKVALEVTTGAGIEVTAKESVNAEVTTGGHATVFGRPSVEHLETTTGGSVDFPS